MAIKTSALPEAREPFPRPLGKNALRERGAFRRALSRRRRY